MRVTVGGAAITGTPLEALADGAATVAIRPDDLTPRAAGPIVATVATAEYRGRDFYGTATAGDGTELFFRSEQKVAPGEVLALGAGPGILAFFMQQSSPSTKLRCVEWDARKTALAKKLAGPAVDVVTADARTVEIGTPDAIVMLDVLHYIPADEQRAWLDRCAAALPPGGVLVLRELDFEKGVTATRVEEGAVKSGWNKGGGVYPWPIAQIVAHLQGSGFDVVRTPAGRGLFRANSLVVATRRPLSPHQ